MMVLLTDPLRLGLVGCTIILPGRFDWSPRHVGYMKFLVSIAAALLL